MSNETSSQFSHRVVVAAIEHDETRLYLMHGGNTSPVAVVQRPDTSVMHVRGGQERNLHGTESKESEYLSSIARELNDASHVLLFGHGRGNSNTMDRFVEFLNGNNKELRGKCIRGERVDFSALSDAQLLALARKLWERQ